MKTEQAARARSIERAGSPAGRRGLRQPVTILLKRISGQPLGLPRPGSVQGPPIDAGAANP